MRISGERISFVPPQHPEGELPFMDRLVISVHLSGTGTRPILLQLDSGSDGPILYPGSEEPEVQKLVHGRPSAARQRNQCAAGFFCRAVAERADRQPYS